MIKRYDTLIALIVVSWFTMTTLHECGHIVGGWIGGATLTSFDLAPWRLPYSLHYPDPIPRLTLWAGPGLGVLIPLSIAFVARHRWTWFVADFCLIANGIYISVGWVSGNRYLDTPRMLAAGVHPLELLIFCGLTIGYGYRWFRSDCIAILSPSDREALAQ